MVCRRKNLIGFLLVIVASFAQAKPLKNFETHYDVYYHNTAVGKSTGSFTIDKNQCYKFTWKSKTTIPLTNLGFNETSIGCYQNQMPKPSEYFFDSHELKKDQHYAYRYDWKSHQIIDQLTKQPLPHKLVPGLQDRTSVLIALRQSFINSTPLLKYTVLERGKIKTYEFKRHPDGSLDTKLGKLNTIKLTRTSKSGKHQSTLWLAKDLNYLIVSMQQYKEGKLVTRVEISK